MSVIQDTIARVKQMDSEQIEFQQAVTELPVVFCGKQVRVLFECFQQQKLPGGVVDNLLDLFRQRNMLRKPLAQAAAETADHRTAGVFTQALSELCHCLGIGQNNVAVAQIKQ